MPLLWIDETGFHRARLSDIKATIEGNMRAIYGAGIDLGTHTTDGQEIGTRAEMFSDVIQAVGDVFAGRGPAGQSGAQLARSVRLNGLTKKVPTFSETTETLGGTPGAFIAAGARIANVTDETAIFVTVADATIGGGGTVNTTVRATIAGKVPGDAGDVSKILTVISGWTTATNASDVSLGDVGETDPKLRARRASSVALPSQGIVDGLEALLLQTKDVTQAVVRENPEDTVQTLVDGGTLAPHAIQVIAQGGIDADVANAIWLKRSAGVTMIGATTATVTDSQGVGHTIKFDRPTDAPIYVRIVSPAALTSDQQAAVRAAIVSRGTGQLSLNGTTFGASQIGKPVDPSDVMDAITFLRVTSQPGLKVDEIDISLSPAPTSDAEIVLAFNQIATWSAGNITFSP